MNMAETKKTASTSKKVTKTEAIKETEVKETKKVASTKKEKAPTAAKTASKKDTNLATRTDDKKAKEVKKPVVTSAKASALSLKVTPRKCRLVCDLVRGKDCDEALAILFNTHKEASEMVSKCIRSAMANAINNYNMNEDKLYVASIMASDSVKMRRFLPRAKGSASGMVKRFANLFVEVKERN
jgi:large subunit ribosomal protein L22